MSAQKALRIRTVREFILDSQSKHQKLEQPNLSREVSIPTK
jgi:hypothetical protein